jgi:hypothetical protein
MGPTQIEEGQAYWILDNQVVLDLLFKNAPTNPKTILVVHPKSGLVALETRRRYPNAHIKCLVMDDTFNDILTQLGFELYTTPMQFDFIVGNPPYLDGMHIKIIRKCLEHLTNDGVCIMIHPSTPYLRPDKEDLRQHLSSLEFVPAKDVWPDVKLWVPLAIAMLTRNTNPAYRMINDAIDVVFDDELTPFGFNPLVMSIRGKLRSGQTLDSIVERGIARGPVVVQLPRISGNAQKHDMYFLFPQTRELSTNIKNDAGPRFNVSFDDEAPALNFIKFLVSKLAMMGLAVNKLNQNIYLMDLTAIPWLDFTKHWTDEMLYKHFNLTQDEIDFIEALPAHPQRDVAN